mmetsp:Transcript_73559/g.172297  ORF Transcript_73559/g.172297 Transcript_73559/m.172297 type:complete len:295 (-) Transcript_73559:481-1365(-)
MTVAKEPLAVSGAAAKRAVEIEAGAQRLLSDLVGPGDILSGSLRASIAKEATAACDCGDLWLQFSQVSPKETGLFERIEAVEFVVTGGCSKTLASIVHAVVNLQPITNAEWYSAAIDRVGKELVTAGELDANATFEDKVMCMTEIIAVASAGAALATLYKAQGKPLPSWPAVKSGNPHFKSLKEFYTGPLVVYSGYGYSVDSKHSSKISEAALKKVGWSSMVEYEPNVDGSNPFSKLSLTPYSLRVQQNFMEVQYIPLPDVMNFAAKPPPSRCLSRPDLEVVAAAYAGAVTCHF